MVFSQSVFHVNLYQSVEGMLCQLLHSVIKRVEAVGSHAVNRSLQFIVAACKLKNIYLSSKLKIRNILNIENS